MSGNRIGGLKAKKTIKKNFGENFYKRIGRTGGLKSRNGGFAHDHEMARRAGMVSGELSRKGLKFIKQDDDKRTYVSNTTGKKVYYLKIDGQWVKQ